MKEEFLENCKHFANVAGLIDQSMSGNVTIFRNCRKLAVGKLEYLIYKGKKIWHISNVISFDFEDVKEFYYSLEEGYVIRLKG